MDAIPSSVFLLFVLALLAMAGGMGVWLYNYIKNEGIGEPKREHPPVTKTSPQMDASESNDARELLSIYRMKKGDLAIFVQGERYHHLREIKNPRVGSETVEAIKSVMAFAEGWLPAIRQQTPEPPPKESSLNAEAFLEQLRQSDLFPAEKQAPGLLGSRRRRQAPQPFEPLRTPADEINELVQKKMREGPGKIRQDISITTGADGGLCIRVGLQTCTSPDDISDPQIRALVQDAVREWKER